MVRSLTGLALLAAAAASPALAQLLDGPELAGSYPMEVQADGGGCPSLQRTDLEVRRVENGRLDVTLDGEFLTGELRGRFPTGEREFYLTLSSFDGVAVRGGQGFFGRRGNRIEAVLGINFADGVDCTAELQGSRAASAEKAASAAAPRPAAPGPTRIGPADVPPTGPPGTAPRAGTKSPARDLSFPLKLIIAAVAGLAFGYLAYVIAGRRAPDEKER